jgi:predicted nucleotidyltransferase component of viral defense system
MVEREQALIARVLDLFAQRFAQRAVLRGGMVLRILGSSRFTNDLDYVFVPYRSKKDLVPEIVACLKNIEGAEIRHSFNSKCLRVVLTADGTTIQIEAKVAMTARTSLASTRSFARAFNLPPRMICITEHSVALANTLAAWNERRLTRDLYDIWFFLQMGVTPDPETLESRLKKPEYSRLVVKKDHFSGSTTGEFYEFLRQRVSTLTDSEIRQSMADYLPPEEMDGLAMQFRSSLVKLR